LQQSIPAANTPKLLFAQSCCVPNEHRAIPESTKQQPRISVVVVGGSVDVVVIGVSVLVVIGASVVTIVVIVVVGSTVVNGIHFVVALIEKTNGRPYV
jgi:uncharacterized Tic20 family protein